MKITPLEGGKEARARAADVSRMILRLCERRGWSAQALDAEGWELLISGEGAEGLRHEAGGHRFVSEDARSGKRHTSFCAVSVSMAREQKTVRIHPSEVEFSFQKASGPGGQHVNKTESAVRASHAPTGLSVLVQSGRCQHENKRLALRLLEHKAQEAQREGERRERQAQRGSREAVGFGGSDRSYRLKEDVCSDAKAGAKMSARRALDGRCDELWPAEAPKE